MTDTATPEAAFNRAAAGYEFNDKKLFPFTAQRQAAAATMGLRFGLVNESDIYTVNVETLKEDGEKQSTQLHFYNQMFADVVTVLWLCSVTESRVLRAMRKVDEAHKEAFAWADEQHITITSPAYYVAASTFLQIMQDITDSTAVPTKESDPAYDADPNE